MSDTIEVVEKFLDAWRRGDLDAAMECWSANGRYELHISSELLPFAGPTTGRDNIRLQFEKIHRDWNLLLFRPGPLRPDVSDPCVFHCAHEFLYRHRASGKDISGRCRLEWRVESGLIASCDAYHDKARIEAFLRLLNWPKE